jgi:hypothetical protein
MTEFSGSMLKDSAAIALIFIAAAILAQVF